jgi:hypothetical protein
VLTAAVVRRSCGSADCVHTKARTSYSIENLLCTENLLQYLGSWNLIYYSQRKQTVAFREIGRILYYN